MEDTATFESPNSQTRPLTTSEKRAIKINQLKAKLQKEQSKLTVVARKERNGQLIAFGVFVEVLYKKATREERLKMAMTAGILLSGRNLDRVLGGFKRLEEEEEKLV